MFSNMKMRLAGLLLAGVAAVSCGGGSDSAGGNVTLSGAAQPQAQQVTVTVESATMPERSTRQSTQDKASAARRAVLSHSVRLGPMDAQQTQQLQKNQVARSLGERLPRQVGVPRDLAATASESAMAQTLRWQGAADGGQAAAISFTSAQAVRLRLGLLVRALPDRAVVRVYAQTGAAVHETTGFDINAMLARNRDGGDLGDAARVYWAPPVEGDEATLEIELPRGVAAADVRVAVPQLSHIVAKALGGSTDPATQAIGDSAVCQKDITCANGAYDTEGNATAQLSFVSAGATYLCTGTLMGTSDGSFIPYLLTANHCFSTQTEASSLVSTFFFRSTSCDVLQSRPTSRVTGGATLLYSSATTDTTFVRLANNAPAGATFAGWSNAPAPLNAAMLGVHHPKGDLQSYSVGGLAGFRTCVTQADDSVVCTASTSSSAPFMRVNWTQGLTEGGSSGSGVWASLNGGRYLVGQLFAGISSCSLAASNGNYSTYGRFDLAYNAALSRWLSPNGVVVARSPVHRFYNASSGAHFYTQNTAERDYVAATNPSFRYEGVAFYAYAQPVLNVSTPIYRFYNRGTGAHFYTTAASERTFVLTPPTTYQDEGVSWNALAGAASPALPVYRFYNAARNVHFYTVSEAEKEFVRLNDSNWRLEGIAYYAWTTQ